MSSVLARVDRFRDLDVLVLGDAVLDAYLDGTVTRLSREAPVPIVDVEGYVHAPGGAGNVAANAAALGARVRLLSVVGQDRDGQALRTALERHGADVSGVLTCAHRRTPAKQRVVASGHMLLRIDEGGPQELSASAERELLAKLDESVPAADVVIVSDYEHGVVSDTVLGRLAELHAGHPRVLVVDAKSPVRYRHVGPTAVKPNYDEVRAFLPSVALSASSRADAVTAACDRLPEVTGAHIVAVTLDSEGAVVCERGRPPYRTYTRPTSNAMANGAGDSFTSGLALALGAGADTPTAAEIASAAATVVLGREGTVVCSATDLREHLADTSVRLEEPARLAERVAFHRRQGRRVVFTNGCFDILHRGHVDYLNRAKALGDVLVVALNTDDGIRRLKATDRPINRLEDRAQVLAALSCVDHLTSFDEDTAESLIDLVQPDVYVKGGDYTAEMLPEAPVVERLGGVVRILPYLEDRSTTGIIDRIRRSHRTVDVREDGVGERSVADGQR